VTGAPNARGLDLWLEKNLIGPIVKNLSAVGYKAEPTTLREFIGEQAEALNASLRGLLERSGQVALTVGKSLYMFLLILMLTAFIVMDRQRISTFFASLPPDHLKGEYGTLMGYVDRGLAGVIRGQLVICAVNGLLTYIGLVILGVRGAALLSLLAGILSLIPIFGTIVSSIPIVLVAATSSLTTGVLALGWIGMIHLLEANLFNPLIMGSHANMHPVIIIFALLAGEHAFGVWGALLAVPTMSIIQSCFLFYRHEIEGLPTETRAAHGAWLQKTFGRFFSRKPKPASDTLPPGGTMSGP
jgi:predicted PurR-regulated permease PerM